jgi:hypothetical protein
MRKFFLIILFTAVIVTVLSAEESAEKKLMRSEDDNAFDVSDWLLSKQGFLPLPTIVSEPAVKYGGGLALLYFYPQEERLKKGISPDISGAAVLYTGNKSWLGAAFHMGYWLDDRIRFVGAVARVDGNLDMYSSLGSIPFSFNMSADAWVIYQETVFRLGSSPFFLGPRYYMVLADGELHNDTFPDRQVDINYSNPGLTLSWDTRDTVFTPSSGRRGDLSFVSGIPMNSEDDPYWKMDLFNIQYFPVKEKIVLGVRTAVFGMWGFAPIYMKPSVIMRGVPLARYQGDFVLQAELEGRIQLASRWDLILLAGGGLTFLENPILKDNYKSQLVGMGGLGFRYEIARKFGMSLGVDLALSNEDWAVAIVMGNSWR